MIEQKADADLHLLLSTAAFCNFLKYITETPVDKPSGGGGTALMIMSQTKSLLPHSCSRLIKSLVGDAQ